MYDEKFLAELIPNKRQGGFLIRLPTGKIAFPDSKYSMPDDIYSGQKWFVEITTDKESVAFFQFIESHENWKERKDKEEKEKAQELLKQAIEEFPESKRLQKLNEKSSLNCSAVNLIWKDLQIDKKRKQEAEDLLDFYKKWDEPEPEKPDYEDPDKQNILCEVIDNVYVSKSWMGDGMRGPNDDGIRTAREPANRYKIVDTIDNEVAKYWAKEPIYKEKIIIEEKHKLVGTQEKLKLSDILSNWWDISHPWSDQMREWNDWASKKIIAEQASLIDGRVYTPCINHDGYPELYELSLENPFPVETGPLISWEKYEEMEEDLEEENCSFRPS